MVHERSLVVKLNFKLNIIKQPSIVKIVSNHTFDNHMVETNMYHWTNQLLHICSKLGSFIQVKKRTRRLLIKLMLLRFSRRFFNEEEICIKPNWTTYNAYITFLGKHPTSFIPFPKWIRRVRWKITCIHEEMMSAKRDKDFIE